jgi:hypothetical protein
MFTSPDVEKLSEKDGEYHLVYTGSISFSEKYKNTYYIPLAKKLAKQKIHLHLYTNPTHNIPIDRYIEYIELDRKEKYFHFEKSLPFDEINSEIAKYDFGLWYHPDTDDELGVTFEKRKTGIGNKLFSYLEAGLPIIITERAEYGKKIVDKYGIGFSIRDEDFNNFHSIISNYDYNFMRSNSLRTREELSLGKKVKELEKFYIDVVGYHQKMK